MSDDLATLTDKLQALLLDDGTLFPDATCTAAIRQALHQFNSQLPNTGATTIDVVAGQLVYELTEALAGTEPLTIIGVYLEDVSGGDNDTPFKADIYSEDNRWFFRLKTAQSSDTLIVRYTLPHTVEDLDSATESTLTPVPGADAARRRRHAHLLHGRCRRDRKPAAGQQDVQQLWRSRRQVPEGIRLRHPRHATAKDASHSNPRCPGME